jgi:SAM-dependent methyltransferase
MAKKGIKVVGTDLCQEYLDELDAKAKRAGLRIQTIHADMRKIEFKNRFDAAGNLWTSFGYFESERDNLLLLKKLYRALKPGGRFCLHVINRDWIIAHYSDTDWQDLQGMLYTEKRKFDFTTSINRGVWTFYKDGKSTSHHVDIRMYSYHELIAMFKQVGFVDIEGFSSADDAPITQHTMMIWVFGVKPRK